MEYREFTGKTVEDAVMEAAIKLETTSDKLDYEILEKGSSGFLGIGSKPAKIKADERPHSRTNHADPPESIPPGNLQHSIEFMKANKTRQCYCDPKRPATKCTGHANDYQQQNTTGQSG